MHKAGIFMKVSNDSDSALLNFKRQIGRFSFLKEIINYTYGSGDCRHCKVQLVRINENEDGIVL